MHRILEYSDWQSLYSTQTETVSVKLTKHLEKYISLLFEHSCFLYQNPRVLYLSGFCHFYL